MANKSKKVMKSDCKYLSESLHKTMSVYYERIGQGTVISTICLTELIKSRRFLLSKI